MLSGRGPCCDTFCLVTVESSAEHESGEFGGRAERGEQSGGSHVTKPTLPGPLNKGWPGPNAVTGPDWGGALEPHRFPSNIETFDISLFEVV